MGEAKRREMIMEEEKEKAEEALKPDAEPKKFLAKMEIVMLPNGNIGLRGPTQNKPLCKMLLAGAEALIDELKSEIVIPRMNIMPGGKITGRG
jgi:hypothetical protein